MNTVSRTTQETRIEIGVNTGNGQSLVTTPLPFLNHMLTTLARYGALDLQVRASGDLKHHLIEDTALTLGAALRRMLPDSARRFGESTVPMDDALVQAVLDVGGRPYYQGPLPSRHYDHFFQSLAMAAAFTLHLRVLRGVDRHHIVEAAFKAFGLALRNAVMTSGDDTVMSTKGSVSLELE